MTSILKPQYAGYVAGSNNGNLSHVGSYANYWSANQDNSSYSYYVYLTNSNSYSNYRAEKYYGLSVRCIKSNFDCTLSNCLSCSSATTCERCEEGYTWNGNACSQNPTVGLTTLQDFKASDCESFPTPAAGSYTSIGTLTDSRDGKLYEIRKQADGKCWMADNLAYGGDTD